MDPSDAFVKFGKLVWFPKPKDRDFNITQLKSLVGRINKEFETGINFACPIDQYDEWTMSYEAIISDFTSKLVSKKDSLAQPLLLQTGVAGSQGVSLFNRDPFSRDRSLDADRENMAEESARIHSWMEELCESLACFNSRRLWAPDLEAQLIKQIRDYCATPRILSWDEVKTTIRERLIDQSPCSIGESLISMVRSLHMPVTIWTNSFLSLKQLHEKDDARLGGYQSYQYWASQIVTSEWATLSDCGIEQPVTRRDMRYFKIEDFLEAASSKPVSAFPDYNMKGAEFAPVIQHVKQLLVPPRYIRGKRLYPPAWDPLKTRSALKRTSDESKSGDEPFDCEACGTRHIRASIRPLAGNF